MFSRGALVASASTRQGLPGSSADLFTRAVPNHPGRSASLHMPVASRSVCLASSKSGGLATFVFLSRPNRVHLRYGSRVRLTSPPAPLLELALTRLRAEQAIYTVNSFHFTRSTRLILAYPTNGRRRPPPGFARELHRTDRFRHALKTQAGSWGERVSIDANSLGAIQNPVVLPGRLESFPV